VVADVEADGSQFLALDGGNGPLDELVFVVGAHSLRVEERQHELAALLHLYFILRR
jgi:hypothetical protein